MGKKKDEEIAKKKAAEMDKANADAVAAIALAEARQALTSDGGTVVGAGGKDAKTEEEQIAAISENIRQRQNQTKQPKRKGRTAGRRTFKGLSRFSSTSENEYNLNFVEASADTDKN